MVQLEKIYMPTPENGLWEKTDTQVQIYLTRPTYVLPGDTIAITGITLKKPNNGDFDFYLIKESIATSVCMPKLPCILLSRPHFCITRALWDLKTNLLYRIKDKLSRTTFALFSSIFLGNRQIVKKEMNTIKDYYKTWGISHHLARGGLHLVIFIAIWGLLLNLTPIPFILKQLLLILICTIYLLLSWTSISFMRAFFTFFVYKLCTLSKVSPNTLHALTIVTFCLLFLNPVQLFFLDFQLSFGITGALAWFNLVMHAQNSVLTHTNRSCAQKY